MRLVSLAAIAMIAAPLAAEPVKAPKAPAGTKCPRTTSYYAGQNSKYGGDRIAPKKLNELPSAVGFMAVYRTVNGCEAPMTIVEYRTGRRR
jgi:poly(3-hydroxybutyrate) depolymerase